MNVEWIGFHKTSNKDGTGKCQLNRKPIRHRPKGSLCVRKWFRPSNSTPSCLKWNACFAALHWVACNKLVRIIMSACHPLVDKTFELELPCPMRIVARPFVCLCEWECGSCSANKHGFAHHFKWHPLDQKCIIRIWSQPTCSMHSAMNMYALW